LLSYGHKYWDEVRKNIHALRTGVSELLKYAEGLFWFHEQNLTHQALAPPEQHLKEEKDYNISELNLNDSLQHFF
jgi:hypothetical protein